MGSRMSNVDETTAAEARDEEEGEETAISDDGDDSDNLFSANLEDVSSDDRTFRSILSLLVGRRSVSHTLRYRFQIIGLVTCLSTLTLMK